MYGLLATYVTSQQCSYSILTQQLASQVAISGIPELNMLREHNNMCENVHASAIAGSHKGVKNNLHVCI